MKKKSVKLVAAVGVLVVLSGAYVGVKTYVAKQDAKETESEEENDETKEIVSISSDDVKSIKFIIDKKEVTFEKDGDTWIKSDESEFPVDQDKLDTLAGSFSSVTAERTLENVEDVSEYELDQPENTITITTEDGETTVIQVGMENDSTSQEYIELNNDSSTVYVVGSTTFQSFEGGLYDFAKSGTFPTVDSSTVTKVSVTGPEAAYTVEEDENNFWNVTGTTGGTEETEKADSAKATSLTSALSSMAYASFVNYNCTDEELSQYGLTKPYATITADYQEEVEKDSSDSENEAETGDNDATEASIEEDSTDSETTEKSSETESSAENVENATDGTETEVSAEDAENATDGTETEVSAEDVENATDGTETEASAEDAENATDGTETEANAEETEEEITEMVDRQLVIEIGDQSSDGGRYVRVNGSNEIYTISEDSLDTFIGKTDADFWDMTVSYLSVNNLDSLKVDYKNSEYTVNVSRETSEDEDAEDTADENATDESSDEDSDVISTTTDGSDATDSTGSTDSTASTASVTLSYDLDGQKLEDSTTFTTFYNKLINMAAQKRLTDKFESNVEPEMRVTFKDTDGNDMLVKYYAYDTNYYAAVVNDKTYLVNKMTVKELFTAFENLAGIDENADSENAENEDIESTAVNDADTENADSENSDANNADAENSNAANADSGSSDDEA